jgi:uncharacterized membrane protein
MLLLALLVVLFAVVHVLPAHADFKHRLKASFGASYGPLYGILSLLLLAAMIWAYRNAAIGIAYEVPPWGRHANFGLSLLGFLCLGIFLFRGSWRQMVRYPMAIAVVLWATGHLLANGDGRSLIFFGGLAVAAVAQAVLMAWNGNGAAPDVRKGHNFLSFMAGLALYGLMTQLHYAVTGMPLVELQ